MKTCIYCGVTDLQANSVELLQWDNFKEETWPPELKGIDPIKCKKSPNGIHKFLYPDEAKKLTESSLGDW
jgi:hypothetical protein